MALFQTETCTFKGIISFGETSIEIDSIEAPGLNIEIQSTHSPEAHPAGWELKLNGQFIKMVHAAGYSALKLSQNESLIFKKENTWIRLNTRTQEIWIDTFGNGIFRPYFFAYRDKNIFGDTGIPLVKRLKPFNELLHPESQFFALFNKTVTYIGRLFTVEPYLEENMGIALYQIIENNLQKIHAHVSAKTIDDWQILSVRTTNSTFILHRYLNFNGLQLGRAFLNGKEIRVCSAKQTPTFFKNRIFINQKVKFKGVGRFKPTEEFKDVLELTLEKIEEEGDPYSLTILPLPSYMFQRPTQDQFWWKILSSLNNIQTPINLEWTLTNSLSIKTNCLSTGILHVDDANHTEILYHQMSQDNGDNTSLETVEEIFSDQS